jgi:hypothetical protein
MKPACFIYCGGGFFFIVPVAARNTCTTAAYFSRLANVLNVT